MVRLSPAVSGTLSGQAGWRIVPGLSQWRKPPTIGEKRRSGEASRPRGRAPPRAWSRPRPSEDDRLGPPVGISESPPRSEVAEIREQPAAGKRSA